MTCDVIIRRETPADYAEVYTLVKSAFATTSYADGDEQDYLNELRRQDAFVPELSLVAKLHYIILFFCKLKLLGYSKLFCRACQ